jgi:hypothetical protein
MKRILFFVCALGLLTYALLSNHALVTAQGGIYELSQSLFGSGGIASGGAYEMTIVVGDPVADEMSGGAYSLGGGILGGGARVVAQVTPTETPTETATPTPTATATATTPGDPSPTATATATATTPGNPSSTATPTATATTPGVPSPTATATPTVPGNTDTAEKLYLPLVER